MNQAITPCSLLGTILLFSFAMPDAVTAQISSDGSVSTTVTTNDSVNFLIENGERAGNNLFHSFSEFSIPTGGEAFFNNATDIANIFSRVTGGSISNIDGLIRANGTANLFLINPSGISFGKNASLSIGGSFLATTADKIVFNDGIEFNASQPEDEPPLLTINIPMGVQFGSSAESIVIQSQAVSPDSDATVGIEVEPGQTIALLGGNLDFPGGGLTASAGRIELGSVGPNSVVSLTPLAQGWTFGYEGIGEFGDINLTQQAFVITNGDSGGNIEIQGRNVNVKSGSAINANTLGATEGGSLRIRATESIEVSATREEVLEPDQFRAVRAPDSNLATRVFGTADGNDLMIQAKELKVAGFAFISASSIGAGNAGDVVLDVERLQVLDGAQIGSAAAGSGNAANLTVRAQSIEIIGVNQDTVGDVFSSGLFVAPQPGSTGNGGNITIDTEQLKIAQGGTITATTLGDGNAGKITIRATVVEVRDAVVDFTGQLAGIISAVGRDAQGDGGEIRITTVGLRVLDGGQIIASTSGTGKAGNIHIEAKEIEVRGVSEDGKFSSSISAFSTTDAPAGSIDINTTNLTVGNSAEISVSGGIKDSGNLTITANAINLDNHGSLKAEVAAGNQGNIQLNSDLLILRNNSQITTDASGTATGGNITLETINLVALENSNITANAIAGLGGNIIITAQGIFLSSDSQITASSEFGIDGVVDINSPATDLSNGLVELPEDTTDPSQQISAGCSGVAKSSFIVTHRGGIPPNPEDYQKTSRVWVDVDDWQGNRKHRNRQARPSQDSAIRTKREPIIEANALMVDENGNMELVAIVEGTIKPPVYQRTNCVGNK
ncbi:MAG: filamentous hemagglutinin N-terminal domain-containing protein [Moorea sp. SIOASIH]|uniref:two-partner secretion domain-containing protein n=1 Tax=Moorena sp. SIOASIH TaxID=2607817 RepID=UPI0013B91358|nr:filamentous hemagglutinin N-terminal domain-containing protein [Moorena sp. SIOASIH]NEO42144.1 filamentous hemagglutinin N-terminal domain-containing protein [Moorena sp. SIOASIH]